MQTVALSKLTGTRGLIMGWTEVPLDGHTDMYVFRRGGIMAARHRSDILEPIVRPHACVMVMQSFQCKIMHLPTQLRCP